MLWRGLAARRQVDHEERHKVAAAFEMHKGARRIRTVPSPGFDLMQIDGEFLDDRHAFGFRPFEVRIAQEIRAQDLGTVRGWLCLLVHHDSVGGKLRTPWRRCKALLRARERGWTDMTNFATLQKTTSMSRFREFHGQGCFPLPFFQPSHPDARG